MGDLLDDIILAYKNAKTLPEQIEYDDSEITHIDNPDDGITTNINVKNILNLIFENPFVVRNDYIYPIIFLLSIQNDELKDGVIRNLTDMLGFKSNFFYAYKADVLCFLNNVSILPKLGKKWNIQKARNISNYLGKEENPDIFTLNDLLADRLKQDTVNDVISYVFSYCTSDNSQNGGFKFDSHVDNYFHPARLDSTSTMINFSLAKVTFFFYGLSSYRESNQRKYFVRTGDPRIVENLLSEKYKNKKLFQKLDKTFSEYNDKAAFTDQIVSPYLEKFGIFPLDQYSCISYIMSSLEQLEDLKIHDVRRYKEINLQNYHEYSDTCLLFRIGYPFVHSDRKDIYEELKICLHNEKEIFYSIRHPLYGSNNVEDSFLYNDYRKGSEFFVYKGDKNMVKTDQAKPKYPKASAEFKEFVQSMDAAEKRQYIP